MYNYQKDQQLESGETKSIVEKKKEKRYSYFKDKRLKVKRMSWKRNFEKNQNTGEKMLTLTYISHTDNSHYFSLKKKNCYCDPPN